MKPALQLPLSQQLSMTPQLQKAIRLLQLSAHELHCEMQLALESNPMLEVNEELLSNEESSGSLSDLPNGNNDPFELPWGKPSKNLSQANRDDPMDDAIVSALNQDHSTLQEHLLWQLNLIPFTEEQRWIATYIIDAVNEDGLIEGPFCELIDAIQCTLDVPCSMIESVLKRIQQFDPIGVAARDLQECLLLQCAQLPPQTPWYAAAKTLIERHLPFWPNVILRPLKNAWVLLPNSSPILLR